ncbi:MAG: HepT-like ribonuclease domain-containing protein [Pyrinomonadaceae bacterium]
MKGRSDNILFYDILECCQRIAGYIDGVRKEEFESTYLLQDGMVRKLEIIGEAAKGLSENLRDANPNVPWRKTMAYVIE